jgi:uncharacterized membrane protein YkoI
VRTKPGLMILGAIVLSVSGTTAVAADFKMPKTKVTVETCMQAVLTKHAGTVGKLELKVAKGTPIYEFNVESQDGTKWDIECNANTGQIVEIELEVRSAEDPLF